jgi:hypothetical protein
MRLSIDYRIVAATSVLAGESRGLSRKETTMQLYAKTINFVAAAKRTQV